MLIQRQLRRLAQSFHISCQLGRCLAGPFDLGFQTAPALIGPVEAALEAAPFFGQDVIVPSVRNGFGILDFRPV